MIFAFSLSSGKWIGLCAVRQPLQLGWSGDNINPEKTTFEGESGAERDGVGLEHTFLYLTIALA